MKIEIVLNPSVRVFITPQEMNSGESLHVFRDTDFNDLVSFMRGFTDPEMKRFNLDGMTLIFDAALNACEIAGGECFLNFRRF